MRRDERSLPALASVLVPGCAGGRHCADCYRGAATVLAGRLAAGGGYRRDRFLSMVGATLAFDPLRHNTALAAAAIASRLHNRLLLSLCLPFRSSRRVRRVRQVRIDHRPRGKSWYRPHPL